MPVDYDLGTARGRIEIDSSDLGRSQAALTSMGKSMLLLGAAAVAGFGYVVKSAADFEHQMDAVEAVTNANTSSMKKLSEQALDLATNSVYSANEIGGAMEALGKAGITVEEMLGGATQATITLAAAAGDELPGGVERAAEVIANAMKTFGAGADEMDHFADVLVGAAASSTISVEDLATSMRYAGPIASQLGLSIDDLSTVLAVLGDRGIKGSTAGTSLRGVLLSLTPTSAKATEAMKELGLITADGTNQFYDMNGALKPIPEVMELLKTSTEGLTEQQKVQAFNTIFQRRAMNSALIMAELGAAGFDEYAEAIANIDAGDVAATKLDNLTGDITILRNAVDALIIKAGQPFQDMLRDWVQNLTTAVQWISQLDDETLSTIVAIVGIAGAVLLAGGAFLIAAGQVLKLYRTFLELKAGLVLIKEAMALSLGSLLLNPVFLFIAALVALGAALYLAYIRSDEFREAFDKAFDKIQPTIEAAVAWVQNFVSYLDELWAAFQAGGIEGDAFANILDKMGLDGEAVAATLVWLRDALIWLKDAAIAAFDYFADEILPTLLAVGWAIIQGIGAAIDWLTNTGIPAIVAFGVAVGDVAEDVGAWLNEHVVPAFIAFGEVVQGVIEWLIEAWNRMYPGLVIAGQVIAGVLAFIWTLVDDFVAKVLQIWTYLGDNLWRYIQTIWDLIVQVITGAFQIIRGLFLIIGALLQGDWGMAWEGIKSIVAGAWTIITAVITSALELIWLSIQTVMDVITLIFITAWDLVCAVVEFAWAVIWGIITGVIGTIVGAIQAFFDWLIFGSIWTDAWLMCVAVLQMAWAAILSALSSAIAVIMAWIGALPGNIVAWLGDLTQTLWQKGWDILSGFLNGIIAAAAWLTSYIAGIPQACIDALGSLAETLYSAGTDLIQGFIDGIEDKIPDTETVLAGITGALTTWKGPPKTDAVILRENGRLVMQGFIDGLEEKWPQVQALLQGYTGALSGQMIASGSASYNGGSTQVNFDFSNGTFGEGAKEGVEEALTDPLVIGDLLMAARAGRR